MLMQTQTAVCLNTCCQLDTSVLQCSTEAGSLSTAFIWRTLFDMIAELQGCMQAASAIYMAACFEASQSFDAQDIAGAIRQGLRMYSIMLGGLIVLTETEWDRFLSLFRALDGWIIRGFLQLFEAGLTLELARSTGASDFHRSTQVMYGHEALCVKFHMHTSLSSASPCLYYLDSLILILFMPSLSSPSSCHLLVAMSWSPSAAGCKCKWLDNCFSLKFTVLLG